MIGDWRSYGHMQDINHDVTYLFLVGTHVSASLGMNERRTNEGQEEEQRHEARVIFISSFVLFRDYHHLKSPKLLHLSE